MKRSIKTHLDLEMVIAFLKRLDIGTKTYFFECSEKKRIRTIPQNRLYRLWITCISFETGEDTDVLHDIFKKKWLEPEIVEKYGVKVERYTTTNLNTIQFKYFLDKIQTFANSELGIVLPNPDEKYWDEFYSFYVDKL